MGLGWTLSGLASIGHCPRTLQIDNIHGSVNFDANDRYCLNGQRLILFSGAYGADGSVYRTELESFSKITAHGTAGNGPLWFEVKTKSGLTYQLGNTTDSRLFAVGKTTVQTWSLNKMTDVKGNYLTVSYTSDATNGQIYPTRIDYAGNTAASLTPYNSIRFTYNTTRVDAVPTYQAGSLNQTTVLITNIKTYQGATVVRDYRMAYTAGTTTRPSELTSVTQCDATTNCLAPTTFGWQGSRDTLTATTTTSSLPAGVPFAIGDFNWDGLTDITFGDCVGSTGNIYLGTLAGTYSSSSMYGSYCVPSFSVTADFEGNGITDLFQPNAPPAFTAYLNNGTGTFTAGGMVVPPYYFMDADFDGDGRTDGFTQSTTVGSHSYVQHGNGDGTFTQTTSLAAFNHKFLSTADFDGDGCSDVYVQDTDNEWNPTGASNVQFQCNPATGAASATVAGELDQDYFGDFNGDGKTDLLIFGTCSLKLSTGTGFVVKTVPAAICSAGGGTVGDFNGDGRSDFVINNGTVNNYYLSTGAGFVLSSTTTAIAGSAGDFNSDGASDLWGVSGSVSREIFFSYVPELITTFSNGVGATTTVTYDRINKNGALYDKGTPGTYPIQTIDGPVYVVSQLSSSNGTGGTFTANYAYTGAFGNAGAYVYSGSNSYSGEVVFAGSKASSDGLLGFAKIAVTDNQTGLVTTTSYQTVFPYTGQVSSVTTVKPGGSPVTVRSSVNTWQSTTSTGSDGTHYYFVSLQQNVTSGNDLDGTSLPATTSTITYDGYGNTLTSTAVTKIGAVVKATRTVTRTYTNDTTNWLLGQLTGSTRRSVVGTSDLTHTSSFTPDASTGITAQEVVEPGNSTCNSGTSSCTVTYNYTYDAFGNRTQAQTVGSGITTRASLEGYDTKGQFKTSATNALSQSESWDYTGTSSLNFGVPGSHTDLNGVVTSWSYDTLGRTTQEIAPAGTKVLVSYAFCSGVNGGTATCPTYGAYLQQTKATASNGTTQIGPIGISYFDSLGRIIASDKQGFDGSNIRIATQYDSDGYILQTSRPYFTVGGTPAWTSYLYDALGRVTQATMPDGSHTTYTYTGLASTVTNDLAEATTTTVDALGLVATVKDALNHTTQYVYDGFNHLLSVTDPSGNVIRNTYDIRGRKVVSADPDMGQWTYAYDVLSELTTQTDAKSQATSITYDLMNRAITRTETGLYSVWTYGTSAASHNVGNLIEAKACTTSACSTVLSDRTYTYDSLARPTVDALAISGTTFNMTTAYDTYGRQSSVARPSGITTQNIYTSLSYPCRVTYNGGTATCSTVSGGAAALWTASQVDAEMHLTQLSAGNGVTTANTFDSDTGLITDVNAGAGAVANFSYVWDTIGNLTYRGDNNQAVYDRFCYDALNRLTESATGTSGVTTCTSSGAGITRKTLTYDQLGNVKTKSDVGTYTYPTSGGSSVRPHAVSSITGTVNGVTNPSYAYDNNGNTTGSAGRSVTYTAFNMADTITQGTTTVGLKYDESHSRITQTSTVGGAVTTTTYLNDPISGAMSEKVVSGSTTTWHDYVSVGGKLIAERFCTGAAPCTTGATWAYFVSDNLGSVAVVADGTGTVTERLSYDAWGRRRNINGTDNTACSITSATTRGFTAHEMLDSVCEINANARIYDPTIARFMSADSIVSDPFDGQAFNRYSYVNNRPLSVTDPTGHCDGICPGDIETVVVTPVFFSGGGIETVVVTPNLSPGGFSPIPINIPGPGLMNPSIGLGSNFMINFDICGSDCQPIQIADPTTNKPQPQPKRDHVPKDVDGNNPKYPWHPKWDEYDFDPGSDWGDWHTGDRNYESSTDNGKTWKPANSGEDGSWIGGPANNNDNPSGVIFRMNDLIAQLGMNIGALGS